MDGSSASGSMIPSASFAVMGLQGSVPVNNLQNPNASFRSHHQQPSHCQHQGSLVHPPMHDVYPPEVNNMQDCDQNLSPMLEYSKMGACGKNSTSDDDEPSFNTDDGVICLNEARKGKKGSHWPRVKWTDLMVRLLITAVSYLGEDAMSNCNTSGRRKPNIIQKKGKWKLISKVLAERGFYVSPQQCEDKFNDLNKRYKRLTEILGRGTSCKVVENPARLDLLDHISDKAKDDARKILSSKHLFYEEMCSYHNGNRLNLPANPSLQRSLQLALSSKDAHDMKRTQEDDEDDQEDSEDREYDAEDRILQGDISGFRKRMKHGMDHEESIFPNPVGSKDFNRWTNHQGITMDAGHVTTEGPRVALVHMHMIRSHSIHLEEQSLHIQSQMLELEKQRFKWQCFSKKKDRELDKMRIENERMRVENEKLALELKHKQVELGIVAMSELPSCIGL